jgi:polar amino acid transport system substrate-binding protein
VKSGGRSWVQLAMGRSAAALVAVALLLGACGGSEGSGGGGNGSEQTLTIGTSADFPPMLFRDEQDPTKLIGFEVDMVGAIMGHLKMNYEFKTLNFDGLIPGVQAGQLDLVVSDVYDTAERDQVVDFVDYVQSGLAVMVAKENASQAGSYSDLCGKALGILKGSPFEDEVATKANNKCTDNGQPEIDIQTFPAVADELPQLDNGRLFGILEDVLSLSYIQKLNSGKYEVVFQDPGLTKSGIVVDESNDALKSKLESGFEWYKSSGQYAKDAERWGLPKSALI